MPDAGAILKQLGVSEDAVEGVLSRSVKQVVDQVPTLHPTAGAGLFLLLTHSLSALLALLHTHTLLLALSRPVSQTRLSEDAVKGMLARSVKQVVDQVASHSLTLSLSHSLTLPLSPTLTLPLSHSLALLLSCSFTLSLSHSLALSLSHSLALTQQVLRNQGVQASDFRDEEGVVPPQNMGSTHIVGGFHRARLESATCCA